MLTINAQTNNCSVVYFVADEDGERIAEFDGGLTLGAIADTGGIATGARQARCEALRQAIAFCGEQPYWMSPAVQEAEDEARSAFLECMWRS